MIKEFVNMLIEKLIFKPFGSLMMYHLILKNKLLLKIVDFISGNNVNQLSIVTANILAARDLKKICGKFNNIKDVVEIALSYNSSLHKIPPFLHHTVYLHSFQIKSEIIGLLRLIRNTENNT